MSNKWLLAGNMDAQGTLHLIKKLVMSWNKEINGDINEKIVRLEQLQFQKDEVGAFVVSRLETNMRHFELCLIEAKMLGLKARFK